MNTEARKAARAKHTELLQTTAVEAANAAIEGHAGRDGAGKAQIHLSDGAKAELKKVLPDVVKEVFSLAEIGIDAGLETIPFAGKMAENLVNPMIEGFEPAALAKLESLLGL